MTYKHCPSVRSQDRKIPIDYYARLPRLPITVVLDNLRSRFNVGAIFRTCECARIEKLITCGITVHPPDEKLVRTAMGTCEFVPHEHMENTVRALEEIKAQGRTIVALEITSGSVPIHEASYPRPLCLVVGNEALGISREALEAADQLVEIPVQGYKNSLNVSVALGIALFEVLRQWGIRSPDRPS